MLRKSFLLALLFVFAFLISGCTLIKGTGGAAIGLGKGATIGAKEGFKDDVEFVKSLEKADAWIRENLW